MFNEIFMKIAWFSTENNLILITVGFPIENTKNLRKFENPRVFKRTFPLKLCVGSDGRVSMMSKKHKSIKISMVLEDFAAGIFFSGVDIIKNSQNTENIAFGHFL